MLPFKSYDIGLGRTISEDPKIVDGMLKKNQSLNVHLLFRAIPYMDMITTIRESNRNCK